jgi:hypothetical protein
MRISKVGKLNSRSWSLEALDSTAEVGALKLWKLVPLQKTLTGNLSPLVRDVMP